jgi:DNA polymerase
MFHPAAALHQPSLKSSVERDFMHLPELISKSTEIVVIKEEKPPENTSEPTQLSLF